MDATQLRWSEIDEDNPVPLLTRRSIHGEQMLVAKVRLAPGCHVALHQHVSEQTAIVVSGRVRWTVGPEGTASQRSFEMGGGEILKIPANVWHGVDAIEDTEIIDILSPPGPMGVDKQGGH